MKDKNRGRKRRETPRLSVLLSIQDLNYIDGALRTEIWRHTHQAQFGNIPYILKYTQKLQHRLEVQRRKFSRSLLSPTQKRLISKLLRNARKFSKNMNEAMK